MGKTFVGCCIRRWKDRFKPICDSKVSPEWRKRDLKGIIRCSAIVMAESMVYAMARENARVDFEGDHLGWGLTPEFSQWFSERRDEYMKEALDFLNEDADINEIDDAIEAEISYWEK